MSTAVFRRSGRTLALGALPVALISTFVVFLMTYLATANPAAEKLGVNATAGQIAKLNHQWGLDKGFFSQYFTWLSNAVHGNLGISYFSDTSVAQSIWQRLPVDLSITVVAIIVAVLVGFSAGIVAALRPNGIADRLITIVASVLVTVPEFWLAIMSIVFFAVTLRWLPSGGYIPITQSPGSWLTHMLLPGGSLGLTVGASVARQLRSSLVTTLGEDFVVGARVRGLSPRRVLFRHALRNAAAPAVAVVGLAVPTLLGGAVIAEQIFGLPGIGQLALDGATSHDIPVIQGVLIVTVVIVLISNLAVDGLLGWLRPATRRT